MSRKTKRHKTDTENQNVEMHTEIPKNSNKLLIGSIAAGCGVAATIFLLTTDSGKRVRNGIEMIVQTATMRIPFR